MTIVLDTNILLVSVSSQSKYHWVYKSFLEKKYRLAVSTEILLEYEEIIERFMGAALAQSVVQTIAYSSNTNLVTRWFCWNLIENDKDDNKFIDAYIAGGSDFLVTQDKHFDVLKAIPFPPVNVLSLSGFQELITKLQ